MKRDIVRFYAHVGPSMATHLPNRPLTLTRYPNAIHGQSFYQKRWENAVHEFAEMVRLFSSTNEGDGGYLMVNNLPTLLWLAQLANIEFHPWLSRTVLEPDGQHPSAVTIGSIEAIESSVLNYPDFLCFDLDPYIYSSSEAKDAELEFNRRAFDKGVEMAKASKEVLDSLSLSSFIKTSGKTGLHIYVPILRRYPFTVTRKACEVIERHLMQMHPQELTMEWSVNKRTGKGFLDHK